MITANEQLELVRSIDDSVLPPAAKEFEKVKKGDRVSWSDAKHAYKGKAMENGSWEKLRVEVDSVDGKSGNHGRYVVQNYVKDFKREA